MSKKLLAAAEGVICFVLAFLIAYFDIFAFLDDRVSDLLYQQPRGINHHIKIIGINDSIESRSMLGNFSEWQRDEHSERELSVLLQV